MAAMLHNRHGDLNDCAAKLQAGNLSLVTVLDFIRLRAPSLLPESLRVLGILNTGTYFWGRMTSPVDGNHLS